MIPFLLAAVGGYLIGQSRRDEQYAKGGMTRKGGKVFEVDGKKFYYHKDGLVYDDKHILYGGRYSNLDEAYLSVKRNESLNKGTSRMDYGGMMADGGEIKAIRNKDADYFVNEDYEIDEELDDVILTSDGFSRVWAVPRRKVC